MIFVDMHAETTSEKIAMGRFLDGRVSAVVPPIEIEVTRTSSIVIIR